MERVGRVSNETEWEEESLYDRGGGGGGGVEEEEMDENDEKQMEGVFF